MPFEGTVGVTEIGAVGIFQQEFVGMIEVNHQSESDIGIRLMEVIEHRQERAVETFGIEGHLLGAQAYCFHTRLRQSGQPFAEFLVGQHHGVATR